MGFVEGLSPVRARCLNRCLSTRHSKKASDPEKDTSPSRKKSPGGRPGLTVGYNHFFKKD